MGDRVGIFRGLASALADTLYEVAGFMMVRTTQVAEVGDTTLNVEGTHRWPASGRIYIGGESYNYASKTDSTLDGLTLYTDSTVSGLQSKFREGSVVTYYGRDQTDLDLIRLSFFVQYAEGKDLDLLGRNFGWARPRGMTDTMFRNLLMVVMYLDATTIYSLEKVMDVLVGSGNYTIYEHLLGPNNADHHKVFIDIDKPVSTSFKGKTFMTPTTEQKVPATLNTIVAGTTPTVVYGIYDATDLGRTGTNYLEVTQTGSTDAANPTYLSLSFDYFVSDDLGRYVILGDNSHWKIVAYLGPRSVQLGKDILDGGNCSSGEPYVFTTDQPFFASWMVGHKLQIVSSTNPTNMQQATISKVDSSIKVTLDSSTTTPLVTDAGMTWRVVPNFATNPSVTFRIPRFSVAGTTITTTTPLGVSAKNLHYTTIPSAQMCANFVHDGTDQYPFYLFDDLWYVQDILDLITAAGVIPVATEVT